MRFEVSAMVLMKIQVFCDIVTYCIIVTNVSEEVAPSILMIVQEE